MVGISSIVIVALSVINEDKGTLASKQDYDTSSDDYQQDSFIVPHAHPVKCSTKRRREPLSQKELHSPFYAAHIPIVSEDTEHICHTCCLDAYQAQSIIACMLKSATIIAAAAAFRIISNSPPIPINVNFTMGTNNTSSINFIQKKGFEDKVTMGVARIERTPLEHSLMLRRFISGQRPDDRVLDLDDLILTPMKTVDELAELSVRFLKDRDFPLKNWFYHSSYYFD
ncbi:unnamed protein product [Mytilus coruscus]|uniref:Uncharacterized protein n=1 Tax=Mytilus coruscus TaxID=42192 RepID=A0A6J8AIF8_MYTCO|nr:unnamed protein product [Mytilus coruscus]